MTRHFSLVLLAAIAVCLASCGKSTTKSVVPVEGEVFVGAVPAEGARIVLVPQGDSAVVGWTDGFPRAVVAADGTFKISTFSADDGAPAGDYAVTVTWPEPAPADSEGQGESSPIDRLGGRYSDPQTSQLLENSSNQRTKLPHYELKR
jgi:hypothetical protein